MIILVNLIFLLVFIYNLKKRSENIFKVKISTTDLITAMALFILEMVIWYFLNKKILGLITVVNSILYFLSYFLAVGMSEGHVNLFMAKSIFVLSVPYDRVEEVQIEKVDQGVNLKIKAYKQGFSQKYRPSLEPALRQFIGVHFE